MSFDPDVVLIGGDIAYDDALRACAYSWDNFYWNIENLDLLMNRTVPIVLSIGNHDVGYDALSTSKIDKEDVEKVPLFFLYNPQHFDRHSSEKKVPTFADRSSIHYHVIGNTVHLHLDSGYMLSYESQDEFIRNTSNQFGKFYKFGNYHNPIYPTCYDLDPESVLLIDIQE